MTYVTLIEQSDNGKQVMSFNTYIYLGLLRIMWPNVMQYMYVAIYVAIIVTKSIKACSYPWLATIRYKLTHDQPKRFTKIIIIVSGIISSHNSQRVNQLIKLHDIGYMHLVTHDNTSSYSY